MLFCYERYADDMVFGDSLTGTRDIIYIAERFAT